MLKALDPMEEVEKILDNTRVAANSTNGWFEKACACTKKTTTCVATKGSTKGIVIGDAVDDYTTCFVVKLDER